MRRHLFVIVVSGCLALMLACKKQARPNPWVGSWTLDTSSSRLSELPKQETMQIDAADQSAIRYTIRGVSADGKEYSEGYDGKPDGNAYPVTANGRELGRIAFRWQSERMCTAQGKGAGGATLKETASLSDDGLTVVIKSQEGKDEEETAIYRK